MEIEPNLHPVFVHFTVALVLVATACALASKVLKGGLAEQSIVVSRWLFMIAAGLTILTVGAGIYAFNTVNHDDASHEVMLEHRNLAMASFVLIVITAFLFFRDRKQSLVSIVILLFSIASSAMVLSTAWHGGELVYHFGLGVKSLPKPQSGHEHSHDSNDPNSGHTHSETSGSNVGEEGHAHPDENHHEETQHVHDSIESDHGPSTAEGAMPDSTQEHDHQHDSDHRSDIGQGEAR